MLPENIIYLSVLASVVVYFFFLPKVFSGRARPNLVSWFFWMLAPFIGVFFQLKAGGGLAALPVFLAGFGPLLVIISALLSQKAYWKIKTLDWFCGFLALLALISYVATHNLAISVAFAILSDLLAALPTVFKAWEFPESEHASPYTVGIFNNILGLLIIKKWIFSIYALNVYFVLINLIIVFCIYRRKTSAAFS